MCSKEHQAHCTCHASYVGLSGRRSKMHMLCIVWCLMRSTSFYTATTNDVSECEVGSASIRHAHAATAGVGCIASCRLPCLTCTVHIQPLHLGFANLLWRAPGNASCSSAVVWIIVSVTSYVVLRHCLQVTSAVVYVDRSVWDELCCVEALVALHFLSHLQLC